VLAFLAALIVAAAPTAIAACAIVCAGTAASLDPHHACHQSTDDGLRVAAGSHACGHDSDDVLMPTVGVSKDFDDVFGLAPVTASPLLASALTRTLFVAGPSRFVVGSFEPQSAVPLRV
jgi:hypothetical protein